MTLSITAFGITLKNSTLSIMTRHRMLVLLPLVMLRVFSAECHLFYCYAEYHTAQCHATLLRTTCGQCYKTFYGRKLRLFIISQSVCHWQAFQPNLMFAVKAGAYLSKAPFRCSTLGQDPGLTHKHQTRLERLASDKHSSLI